MLRSPYRTISIAIFFTSFIFPGAKMKDRDFETRITLSLPQYFSYAIILLRFYFDMASMYFAVSPLAYHLFIYNSSIFDGRKPVL